MSPLDQSRPLGGPEQVDYLVVPRERNDDITSIHSQTDSHPASTQDPLQVLVEADDDECLLREATLFNTKEVQTKGVVVESPAIPKRNTLRTSQLLDSLRLNSIKSATKSLVTAHTVYMSSEEDASSTAGDDSDDDYEASSEGSEKLPLRRKSREIIARAVSVVFVGKPCVVELATGRKPVSPAKRPQSEFITRSASTRLSESLRASVGPLRNSSLAPASVNTRASLIPSPSFLSQDPYGDDSYSKRQSALKIETSFSSKSRQQTPNTPTRAFQRLQKTISLVRKQSRPDLKVSRGISSSSSLTLPSLNMSQESQESSSRSDIVSPISYNEMLRSSRRNSMSGCSIAQSVTTIEGCGSPIPPAPVKRGILSGFNLARRRTLRFK